MAIQYAFCGIHECRNASNIYKFEIEYTNSVHIESWMLLSKDSIILVVCFVSCVRTSSYRILPRQSFVRYSLDFSYVGSLNMNKVRATVEKQQRGRI